MNAYEFRNTLKGCKAAVYDLDNTLVDGRVADGMGKKFLSSELCRLHLNHVWLGARNYSTVKRIAEEQGEAKGLEYFFGVIGQTGCANRDLMKRFARDYIQKHGLHGSVEFAAYIKSLGIKQFISTIGCDMAAQASCELYGLNDYTANPVFCQNSVVKSCEPFIKTGEDKLYHTRKMLERRGLSLRDSLVVGNDELDHELMKASKLSAASPLANEETREIADIWIENYAAFLEELERV